MKESWIICIHELYIYLCDTIHHPTGSYLFKVNKGNTRAINVICSNFQIKTPEQCQWHPSGFLIGNFEHISVSISKYLLRMVRWEYLDIIRSWGSHQRWSIRKGKGVLRNFAKLTGKHLCQGLSFNINETLALVFSCEFCEISKNTFFTEHLQMTASEGVFIVGRLW